MTLDRVIVLADFGSVRAAAADVTGSPYLRKEVQRETRGPRRLLMLLYNQDFIGDY